MITPENKDELYGKIEKCLAFPVDRKGKCYAVCPAIYSAENKIPTKIASISFISHAFGSRILPEWKLSGSNGKREYGPTTIYVSSSENSEHELRDVKKIREELSDLHAVADAFAGTQRNGNSPFSKAFYCLAIEKSKDAGFAGEWLNYGYDKNAMIMLIADTLGLRKNGKIQVEEIIKYIRENDKKDIVVPTPALVMGEEAMHDYIKHRIDSRAYEKKIIENYEIGDNVLDIEMGYKRGEDILDIEMRAACLLSWQLAGIGFRTAAMELFCKCLHNVSTLGNDGIINLEYASNLRDDLSSWESFISDAADKSEKRIKSFLEK